MEAARVTAEREVERLNAALVAANEQFAMLQAESTAAAATAAGTIASLESERDAMASARDDLSSALDDMGDAMADLRAELGVKEGSIEAGVQRERATIVERDEARVSVALRLMQSLVVHSDD